jgi:SAM-dependent methyltransferase
MASYDPFAKFYDAVLDEPTATVALLKTLIQEWHPEATSVLELACGTGAVLKHLHPTYQIAGLDLSEGMLALPEERDLLITSFTALGSPNWLTWPSSLAPKWRDQVPLKQSSLKRRAMRDAWTETSSPRANG